MELFPHRTEVIVHVHVHGIHFTAINRQATYYVVDMITRVVYKVSLFKFVGVSGINLLIHMGQKYTLS